MALLIEEAPGAPAAAEPLDRERRLGSVSEAALVLGGYLCISALLYGRGVLARLASVLGGSGSSMSAGHDQGAFVWYLEWSARSISHLRDPLSTMAIYSPHGWNLAWATSIPGPAALLTPLTLLAGPVLAFNLLDLSAPALAAWTAYLLCRHISPARAAPSGSGALTRIVSAGTAPAVAGGLLFGFGTYETVEMINHVNLALVALVPLVPLLVLRRHGGMVSPPWFILALGVVFTAQLLTSTEVLATMALFGALAFALWAALAGRAAMPRIARTAGETLAGLALAAVLGAPFLYQAFHFGNPVQGIAEANQGIDVANLLTTTRATWLPGLGALLWSAQDLHSNITEQTGYLGLPLLMMLGAFAWSFRRTLAGRWLVAFMLSALVLALGGLLIADGHGLGVWLPWELLARLPLLRFAVPSRFMLYLWLAVAVAACMWLARGMPRGQLTRWALFGLVVASLVPSLTGMRWSTRVDRPSLMSSPALARYVPPGSTVLALPYGSRGNSMLWQLQAGFRFRMAGGYASFEPPPQYMRWRHLLHALGGNAFRGDLTPALCSFLRFTGTSTILLREGMPGSWHQLLGPLGIRPIKAGGFRVYPLAERRGVYESRRRCASAGS